MSHDTFYICPNGCVDVDLPEVQWTCGEHVVTRVRRGKKRGRFVIDCQGSLLVVGKAVENPALPAGDPLTRNGNYAVIRNAIRQHLLDRNGVLHECPLCGADVEATLFKCEKCKAVVPADRIAVHHIQYAPTGIAAANLVLQREGGPKEARWVA